MGVYVVAVAATATATATANMIVLLPAMGAASHGAATYSSPTQSHTIDMVA